MALSRKSLCSEPNRRGPRRANRKVLDRFRHRCADGAAGEVSGAGSLAWFNARCAPFSCGLCCGEWSVTRLAARLDGGRGADSWGSPPGLRCRPVSAIGRSPPLRRRHSMHGGCRVRAVAMPCVRDRAVHATCAAPRCMLWLDPIPSPFPAGAVRRRRWLRRSRRLRLPDPGRFWGSRTRDSPEEGKVDDYLFRCKSFCSAAYIQRTCLGAL